MKSIKSILFTAVAALVVLTSCSNSDDYSYAPGEQSPGSYVTAPKTSFVFTPDQEQVITLNVGRTEYSQAGEATLEGNNPAFQVPASVSFEAGEKEKPISIPFTLDIGKTTKLTVKVTSPTSYYAPDSVVVTVKCDYVWNRLGVGTYADNFLFEEPNPVIIQQCDDVPNMYRVVAPYKGAVLGSGIEALYPSADAIDLTIYKAGDEYAGQVLDYDDMVGYAAINTGTDVGYDSEVIVYHPASGFSNHGTPDTWKYNKVLAYQETESNGVKLPGIIQLAPYHYMEGVGGWNHADQDGVIIITFPGYEDEE